MDFDYKDEFVAPTHVCFPKNWERILKPHNFKVSSRHCTKTHCSVEALLRRQYSKNILTTVVCGACTAHWGLFVVLSLEHARNECVYREYGRCSMRAADSSYTAGKELDSLYDFDD